MRTIWYIDVTGIPKEEVDEFLKKTKKAVRGKKNDVFLPVQGGGTRVEQLPEYQIATADEERRRLALDLASKMNLTPHDTVEAAKTFDRFLKGDA